MPIGQPGLDSLARIAAEMQLGIPAGEIEVWHSAVQRLLESWDKVEELSGGVTPAAPDRSWRSPGDDENPLGAWYVQTEITETESGVLAGRKVAIKDNTSVAGVPMMNGSKTVEGFVPSEDATVVTRLLAAGATITGKSVCEDLCFSGGSHTSKTGPVRNPWDPTRSAGGSSSGSAVLVATGEVDMAIGCDQGGSIRMPASWSGVVGHKPTYGLVPYTGAFPIEQTIDHVGPIARTVEDVALMLSVIAGVDGMDPRQPTMIENVDYLTALSEPVDGLRIGVVSEGFGHANSEPEVDKTVLAAVDTLVSAGLSAEKVSVPWHRHGTAIWDVVSVEGATWQMVDGNAYGRNWKGHYDPNLIAFYGAKWRADPSKFSETVKLVAMAGRHALGTSFGRHYAMARNLETRLATAYDTALASYDVLVMPTMPMRATPLPSADAPPAEVITRALEMIANTCPLDVTGHPACSVPAGLAGGLPVGLMIIGRKFDDATVLRVAHAFETAVGGFPSPTVTRRFA
jgi:amidase